MLSLPAAAAAAAGCFPVVRLLRIRKAEYSGCITIAVMLINLPFPFILLMQIRCRREESVLISEGRQKMITTGRMTECHANEKCVVCGLPVVTVVVSGGRRD
jgi:hypothetical protein